MTGAGHVSRVAHAYRSPRPPRPSGRGLPSSTASRDPLFVTMRLHGEVRDHQRSVVRIEVVQVHYTDSRGTRWTLRPAHERARKVAIEKATALLDRLPGASRVDQQVEMLEEQLLGLAIVLLEQGTFETDLAPLAGKPALAGFARLLDARLPARCTREVRHEVERFFEEAVARIRAPQPVRWAPGQRFDECGIHYKVDRVFTRKGRPTARLFGKCYDAWTGFGCKDLATVDVTTGLVLQRNFFRHRDTNRSGKVLFGARRWRLTLTRFRPASRGRHGPPANR